jgi:arabinose-5-phosphate isomerase
MTGVSSSFELAAAALLRAATAAEKSVGEAARLIQSSSGKVVVTGMGKSGLVGRKISATLCSTGTQAVFLHPAEAIHGDLGVYAAGDPTILVSKSGATPELVRLLPMLKQFRSPLIGIFGNAKSPMAREVDVLLDATVEREADEHNLVPTTSALLAMAMGDALALELMRARRFTPEEFGAFHPGGQLGRNLSLVVSDVMHEGEEVAWVGRRSPLKEVVIAMTRCPLGAACVIDDSGGLEGLITDGDLRRALQSHDDIRMLLAEDVMTARPVTVGPGLRLHEAVRLMEDRPSQISVLPVVEPETRRCLGLIRIHDAYRARG